MQERDTGTGALQATFIRGSDYGGGVGGMLYSLRGGTPSYAYSNHRGDITARTDGTNNITWQASYEAFGTRTQETGSTQDRQRGNTKDEDPTGLLNEGFRYRDLEAGVFITRDPAGFIDGPNLYTYARQNPWSKFDPLGLYETEAGKAKYNKAEQYAKEISGNPLTWWKVAPMIWNGVGAVNSEMPAQVDNARQEINKSSVPTPLKAVARAGLAVGQTGHSANPINTVAQISESTAESVEKVEEMQKAGVDSKVIIAYGVGKGLQLVIEYTTRRLPGGEEVMDNVRTKVTKRPAKKKKAAGQHQAKEIDDAAYQKGKRRKDALNEDPDWKDTKARPREQSDIQSTKKSSDRGTEYDDDE